MKIIFTILNVQIIASLPLCNITIVDEAFEVEEIIPKNQTKLIPSRIQNTRQFHSPAMVHSSRESLKNRASKH